jgi:heptosyltransferase II
VTADRKLLVVGPSWVGDMVIAQSLYRWLRQRNAGAQIHVLAPPWSLPLLARMPEVTAGIELPLGHGELGFSARRALGRRLRAAAFDRAIVLPRSLKAALVPFFAKIPVRTGFRGEWRYGLINDMRPFDPARLNQTVLRFLALGVAAGEPLPLTLPEPALTVDARGLVLERLGLRPNGPIVAMMPGAEYGPAKRWPAEQFGRLAARLVAAGAQVWLLGSTKEAPLGEEIVAAAGSVRVRNLCGRTSLTDAVDLLAHAAVAVSNDSGLMHVAAAVGTHVVALYGSSSPDFTPPMTPRKTVVYRALPCSPCFARQCPLGHLDCLRGIGVDQVLAATVAQLVEPAVGGGAAPESRSGIAQP